MMINVLYYFNFFIKDTCRKANLTSHVQELDEFCLNRASLIDTQNLVSFVFISSIFLLLG